MLSKIKYFLTTAAVLPVMVWAIDAQQYIKDNISAVPSGTGPIKKGSDALGLLGKFAEWASIAFWVLAFIFVLVAAFQYFTAGGNPEKVKEANKRLLWAVIAIVVGLMSYGMTSFVNSILEEGAKF